MDIRGLVSRHYIKAGLLASYPRSGSAMVRIALHHCYGQSTGSVYREENLTDAFRSAVGSVDDNRGGIFYKTHDRAVSRETVPVIIIVRDPRSVFASLYRYYRDTPNRTCTMEEVIEGHHPWGDWSEWVQSWARYAPRDALWLRYEDFEPAAIGEWFGFQRQEGIMPRLEDLHREDPVIFGQGSKIPVPSEHDDHIVRRHGSMMTMLGYRR